MRSRHNGADYDCCLPVWLSVLLLAAPREGLFSALSLSFSIFLLVCVPLRWMMNEVRLMHFTEPTNSGGASASGKHGSQVSPFLSSSFFFPSFLMTLRWQRHRLTKPTGFCQRQRALCALARPFSCHHLSLKGSEKWVLLGSVLYSWLLSPNSRSTNTFLSGNESSSVEKNQVVFTTSVVYQCCWWQWPFG